jgi:NADH-quinone oxidoreductase subunit F
MNESEFDRALVALPRERTQLLPALLLAQENLGHVPDWAVERIAAYLRLTRNDVEGVASSYPELRRRPAGAQVIRVCSGLSCWAAGGDRLLATLEGSLGIRTGETTPDSTITLEETPCAFVCATAPVVELDGVCRGRATEETVRQWAAQPPATVFSGDSPTRRGARRVPLSTFPSTTETLGAMAESARRRLTRRRLAPTRVLVGAGGCGHAVGAGEVLRALRQEVQTRRLPIGVLRAGCTGMCYEAVQVTLQRPEQPDVTWSHVEPSRAAEILQVATGERPPSSLPGGLAWAAAAAADLRGLPEVPFLADQCRTLLEHHGRVHPTDLDEALARGAYRGLARALSLPPEAVSEEVLTSGLAGRGGAYFPTGRKWQLCREAGPGPRYLVVNAEEGEPGVFKDRHLLEGDPHRVIEGLLIAAYAIGAERVYAYVNGQAALARARLEAALREAAARNLVGERVLGSTFSCRVEIRVGAGGYVLGEETVLLESIEGQRAMPRIRPPHTVEAGLWGQPTVINNVETLANVALILERGADWFSGLGTSRAPGTKLVAVSGDVARPGLVEVEMGTSLRRVLMELAGGIREGRRLQAVLTGGPSGNLVPPDCLDTALEPRHPEVLLGSGNLVALDDTRPLLEVVRRLTRFNAEESCGKCTPCREGVNRMWEILERVARDQPRPSDRGDLYDLGDIAAAASICGLGKMAPNPVHSALRHFTLPGLGPER